MNPLSPLFFSPAIKPLYHVGTWISLGNLGRSYEELWEVLLSSYEHPVRVVMVRHLWLHGQGGSLEARASVLVSGERERPDREIGFSL